MQRTSKRTHSWDYTFEDKIFKGENIIVKVRALYYVDEKDAL